MAGWRKFEARTQDRGRRRGFVFSMRVAEEERAELEAARDREAPGSALGPFLLRKARAGITRAQVLPGPPPAGGTTDPGEVLPRCAYGPRGRPKTDLQKSARIILDLCAGSGAWSRPYEEAGYSVRRVTLPIDVRTWEPPRSVWGVLAAPPCTEFSLAKNGRPRNFIGGLEVVGACLRVIMATRPAWWALENPVGLLGHFLGAPDDVFEPWNFGDLWTKRTALWGSFCRPKRTRFTPVKRQGPPCEACGTSKRCGVSDHVAVTPPGFARAFFEANP